MKINKAGLDLVKSFEGCMLKAYRDIVGVLTIGYGHTGDDVYENQLITQQEADELLLDDMCQCEAGLAGLVTVPLTDNQFAALVSFSFNLGLGALAHSTLLKKLNAKDYPGAADEFLRWNQAGGKVVNGIARRRATERELFLKE